MAKRKTPDQKFIRFDVTVPPHIARPVLEYCVERKVGLSRAVHDILEAGIEVVRKDAVDYLHIDAVKEEDKP